MSRVWRWRWWGFAVWPQPVTGEISAVWANEGGDKFTREELRVGKPSSRAVKNSCWDGAKITDFRHKNEVVNFNLVLEATSRAGQQCEGGVRYSHRARRRKDAIEGRERQSRSLTGLDAWIELFYIRYLQIKGTKRDWRQLV